MRKVKVRTGKNQIRYLHKKMWDLFSIYIRKRDEGTCYTCGKQEWDEELGEWTIRGMNAGHFRHNVLDFDEMNINCQCSKCNHYLSGNGVEYSRRLIKDFGLKAVNELHRRADRALVGEIYTEEQLLGKIEEYKKKIDELRG